MEIGSSAAAADSIQGNLMARIPWWQRNADAEKMQAESQAQLNAHFGPFLCFFTPFLCFFTPFYCSCLLLKTIFYCFGAVFVLLLC